MAKKGLADKYFAFKICSNRKTNTTHKSDGVINIKMLKY